MTIKADCKITDFAEHFNHILKWHKARAKFFIAFLSALIKLQTVCFTKLAQGFNENALVESNLRRIQRFFAEFIVDSDIIAKLIFSILPSQPPYHLCLDRTNWKFGLIDINILMISVAYEGVAIPLIWKMLPKKGNSNSQERIELLDKYILLFGKESINDLLADREFIGDQWKHYLIRNQIKYYIRIRENMWVHIPGKELKKAFWLFNSLPLNTASCLRKIVSIGDQWMYLSGLKVVNKENQIEYVIVASYCYNPQALDCYKVRWQIETMFKAFKTSGFNLEDTHITDLNRISKMLSLISVAFIWAYIVGIYKHESLRPIKVKNHGRKQYSFFKYGLIFLANALLCNDYECIMTCLKVLSCT
jgi:hypothetical protein